MSAAPTFRIEHPAGKAVIGPSVIIKGQIQSHEDLTIEGKVEGTIEMSEHRLTVDARGHVQAGVHAHVVEVQGSIEGKVEAVDKVYIRKGATFVGDIHSTGIVIEDGGYIKGNVELTQKRGASRSVQSHVELEVVASSSQLFNSLSDKRS
jgi:cytoskeletal protein CcmA (bactofilin family)